MGQREMGPTGDYMENRNCIKEKDNQDFIGGLRRTKVEGNEDDFKRFTAILREQVSLLKHSEQFAELISILCTDLETQKLKMMKECVDAFYRVKIKEEKAKRKAAMDIERQARMEAEIERRNAFKWGDDMV